MREVGQGRNPAALSDLERVLFSFSENMSLISENICHIFLRILSQNH